MKKEYSVLLKKNGLRWFFYVIAYDCEDYFIARNWFTGRNRHIYK